MLSTLSSKKRNYNKKNNFNKLREYKYKLMFYNQIFFIYILKIFKKNIEAR